MKEKIDLKRVERYAIKLSKKLCQKTFDKKKTLDKKDIESFSYIEQLNQILLKNLHTSWKKQYEILQSSPFFDYENPEVREALENIIKILPKHIKITRKKFIPLLEKSIKEVILLTYTPIEYFTEELRRLPKKINIKEELESFLVFYYDTYKNQLEKVLQNLSKTRIIAKREKVIKSISKSMKKIPPPPWEDMLIDFTDVLPLPVFFTKEENIVEKNIKQENGFHNIEKYIEKDFSMNTKEEKEEGKYVETILKKNPVEKKIVKEEISNNIEKEKETKPLTLYDKLQEEKKPSLHEKIKEEQSKRHVIMSVHQKIKFIQYLFKENKEDFEDVIKLIENTPNYRDIMHHLREKYITKYNWNLSDDTTLEFLSLIDHSI